MADLQVSNITPDLLRVNIPAISTLGFIHIVTNCPLQKFWCQEKNECYFQNDFAERKQYFEITDHLLRLSQELSLPELAPVGKLRQFEFIIETEYWYLFINKLAQSDLNELQLLAKELSAKTQTAIQNNSNPTNNFPNGSSGNPDTGISLIDLDRSIENKLIFYFLFQSSSDSTAKILEKIELMTLEQKEKFLEQIFQKSPLQKLPKIIYNHIFCTFKVNAPLYEILELINYDKIKITLKKLNIQNSDSVVTELANLPNSIRYINALQEAKSFYEHYQNIYIIPLILKQTALIALDLQGINELYKIKNHLSEKTLALLCKEATFINNFRNN